MRELFLKNKEKKERGRVRTREPLKKKTAKVVTQEPSKNQLKGGEQTSQSETSLREIWKMALSPCAFGAELALCQRCSRRIAEKDGDDGKLAAARSSSEREQKGGGDSTKVEAAKRRRTGLKRKKRQSC